MERGKQEEFLYLQKYVMENNKNTFKNKKIGNWSFIIVVSMASIVSPMSTQEKNEEIKELDKAQNKVYECFVIYSGF